MDRPNELRIRRVLAKGTANLANQVGKIFFDDERSGPQPFEQVVLGHRFRPVRDQQVQQVEGFG